MNYEIEKKNLLKIKTFKNLKKKKENNDKVKIREINIFCFVLLIIVFFIIKALFKRENNLNQSILRGEQTKKNYLYDNNNTSEKQNEDELKYFACLCTIGKMENLYARFLVQYYRNIGFEKFIFVDNNQNNSQVLSDVLQDYINNGTVDIINHIGEKFRGALYNEEIYQKYKNRCEWLGFFDFDEYLVMFSDEGKNITIKEYLTNPRYDNCEGIEINWVLYYDNDNPHYENKSLNERFTKPNFQNYDNRFVKSMVRGNLSKPIFTITLHQPNLNLKLCDSDGKPAIYYPDCIFPPKFKYAYLMHYSTKSPEEFIEKMRKNFPDKKLNYEELVENYFSINNFTIEKLKSFENKLNMTFDRNYKIINNTNE